MATKRDAIAFISLLIFAKRKLFSPKKFQKIFGITTQTKSLRFTE